MSHQFAVESRSTSAIEIRHVVEGHRYAFEISPAGSDRRTFQNPVIREGLRAALKGKFFLDEARLFAEREGRIANMID